jgi:glycerol-3-phosphate dehydrogenase
VKAASSGRTADLSRRHKVTRSESGVITVTGGKLTTYREMAEDTVDEVVDGLDGLPRSARRCRTARHRLRGAQDVDAGATGVPRHLADRFGSEAAAVRALIDADPTLGEPLVPGLPYLRAEAVHAARHEMATTIDDVLTRRTRARLQARDASAAAAPLVAQLMAAELGWSPDEAERQVVAYVSLVDAERDAPGLPAAVEGPTPVS